MPHSRHLERKHDLIDDKESVRTQDRSVTVCKNCWSKIVGPFSHISSSQFTCVKPRHKLTPTEKWWTWFDAFCGPRTPAASEYLDAIMGEVSTTATMSMPLSILQGSQELEHPMSRMTFPGSAASGSNLVEAWSPQPYVPNQAASTQQLLRSPEAEHSPSASSMPQFGQRQSNGYIVEQHSMVEIMTPGSQQQENFSVWHHRAFSSPVAQPQISSNEICNEREARMEELLAQLRRAEEKARLAEVENQELREINKEHRIIIKNLSEGKSILPLNVMSLSRGNNAMGRTLFTAPTRSNTRESTDSDVSGIATQEDPKSTSFDEFLAEFPESGPDLTQDTQGVHYLPEKNTIPHLHTGQPSTAGDSGYGTNPVDVYEEPMDFDPDIFRLFTNAEDNCE